MDDIKKSKKIEAYYEALYSDSTGHHRNPDDYRMYLKQLGIRRQMSGKFLDIACGRGFMLANAERFGFEPFGLDISLTALRLARMNTDRIQVAKCAADEIGFKDRTFDYVSCLGSLEHFLDMSKAILEMKRVAKKTARFCISVPNTIHYRLDAKSKWGVKKVIGTRQKEMHEELHAFPEWKAILESHGLRIIRVYKDRYFIRKRNAIKNLLFFLWLFFLPLRYSYQFIFICEVDVRQG